MLWVPAASALVLQAAFLVLRLPLSATWEQPAIATLPSVKVTLPVGAAPTTVAVKVTLTPAGAGSSELATVVVAAGPGGEVPRAIAASGCSGNSRMTARSMLRGCGGIESLL
jgi:hypothetical protein